MLHTEQQFVCAEQKCSKIGDKTLRFSELCTWKIPDKSATEIKYLSNFMQIISFLSTPQYQDVCLFIHTYYLPLQFTIHGLQ